MNGEILKFFGMLMGDDEQNKISFNFLENI